VKVRVCPLRALSDGEVRVVRLGADEYGLPREVLVMTDPTDGKPRAYLNVCKHLPIPIDSGSRDFYAEDDRVHLICHTHGALYRVSDGVCVEGPCDGEALDAVTVEIEDEDVYVSD